MATPVTIESVWQICLLFPSGCGTADFWVVSCAIAPSGSDKISNGIKKMRIIFFMTPDSSFVARL
jgi:hypothetical protein